ncbi:hypothetical protein Gohar_019031 [Gossypium harknessii]|uniref:RHOMBOID-like protein n=1 Tax=Gossypium harknessii TaxID=34285 RepID=A0A7J9GAX2_9ROSI|nr:hypothetical protein [Gossypium harknessii]
MHICPKTVKENYLCDFFFALWVFDFLCLKGEGKKRVCFEGCFARRGMDSKIEIKVTNPKNGDKVVHSVRPGHATSPSPSSQPSQSSDGRRRRQGQGYGHGEGERQRNRGREGQHAGRLIDFMPFKKWVPWMIPGFVLVNIFLFMITMYINNCPKNSKKCVGSFLGRFSFQPFKENPLLGPSSSTLEKMGALEVSKVVKGRQAWRMISCIWLHAGVFHILANMLSLLFIGIRLEQEFGFVRIGMLYLIAGFGGSILSSLFIQTGISVGASGALFGLLGSMLSELITNWTIYSNKARKIAPKFNSWYAVTLATKLPYAMGILPHVDNFAHIGGFISGFLLGFVFLIRPQFGYVSQKKVPPGYIAPSRKPKHKTYQYVLWSTEFGKSLNLTCISNGKSEIYPSTEENTSQVQQLCSKLCG